MKFGSKQMIPLSMIAVAGLFIYTGISQFAFWVEGPTAAFVPTIISAALIFVSLLAFIQSFKEEKPHYPKENNYVIISALAIVPGIFVIGVIPTLIIYVIAWLKLVEKTPWKQTFCILAVILALVFGVFVSWLHVPFSNGILFDMLQY